MAASASTNGRVVTPTVHLDDAETEPTGNPLRPRTLAEFIGQDVEKEKLRVALVASRQRGEVLEHLLLSGPPGLGKTSLANIVAAEVGGDLIPTSGPVLEKPGDLVSILTNLKPWSVLFIDEIHRMPRTVEEFLYPAMEDFKVEFVVTDPMSNKSVPISIPVAPFTLIGATTRKGMIAAPLRDRFGLQFDLDFYTPGDLKMIVEASAPKLGMALSAAGALEVARRARGTPRVANRLLRRVRDYDDVHPGKGRTIQAPRVDKALRLQGVDSGGLDALDRRYLMAIVETYQGGPVGVAAIAATMQQERDTIEDVVEPYLLHQGYVVRTQGGRKVTDKALHHLSGSMAH